MTREEAKNLLIHILMTYEPKDQYGDLDDPEPYEQAVTMAIEALTYQNLSKPNNACGDDLISRAKAIALVNKAIEGTDNKETQNYLFEGLRRQMWSLPSAEPKTGEWEEVEDYNGDVHYKCNKCGVEWVFPSGTPIENNANFCPKCGADMRGEEE